MPKWKHERTYSNYCYVRWLIKILKRRGIDYVVTCRLDALYNIQSRYKVYVLHHN